ncbi:MAG: GNAT family N-acetyltransferase, partial [Tateyamaria sp.]
SVWGAFAEQTLVAMATLHVLPNVTQGGRPYALIENVVTHAGHRGTGAGRRVMDAAIAAAWDADCYKIMLLTGRTAEARGFYEKLGFVADEKWGMTIRRGPVRT